MSRRPSTWLAWSLGALSVVMFVAAVVLFFVTRSVQPPSSWGTGGLSAVLIFLLPFLAFPLVGALIASRRPENPIGWICLAVGFFWMLNSMTSAYGVYGMVANPGSVPLAAQVGSLGEWLWVPAAGLVGSYLILLFPDGKLLSRRWRPLAWLSGAVTVLLSLSILLTPGPLGDLGGVRNPFGLEGHPWVADALKAGRLLLLLCFLASALSLVLRYRRSGGEEREQIKWIAFAASVFGLVYLAATIGAVFVWDIALDVTGGAPTPLWLQLLQDAVSLSSAGISIAIGFAVLKYRLYEIDLLINRTLVYGALTATLVLVYFGGVATTEAIFRALTGQQEQPQLAIVVTTLVIAALFNPLRRRIQSFIDRRFYRKKYDARKTLEAFSAKLRDETDLDALSEDLVGVVRETMQPAHVSLWLRPDTPRKGEQAV
jgi:hypothetical protein